MSKTNSVIEVNGNRYDALTGQLLSAAQKAKTATHSSGKKVIDGFVLGAHHTSKKIKKTGSSLTPRSPHKAQEAHKSVQKSRTLMRQAVKKPAASKKQESSQIVAHKPRVMDFAKEFRAKTAVKHPEVNRFGHFTQKQNLHGKQSKKTDPVKPEVVEAEVMPANRMPSMVTSVSHQKLEKMLDEALMKAEAHKHMLNTNAKRHKAYLGRFPKWVSIAAVGIGAVLVSAYIVWQKLPAVAVHIASARAHVNASVPAYTPNGFGFAGPLKYSPGTVTMQFKNRADDSLKFIITQKASNINSTSLASESIPKDTNVQTSQVSGTTVYIYGTGNDAMWVNHDVLYKLDNKAELTTDQVLRIVQSL